MLRRYLPLPLTLAVAVLCASPACAEIDLTLFATEAMITARETVDCTLTTGVASQCATFVVKYLPDNLEIWPFCPTKLDKTGGLWDRDGFAMFCSGDADRSVAAQLDACGGITGLTATHPEGEYLYLAAADFPRLPPCLTGIQADDNFSTTAQGGIGAANGGGSGSDQPIFS